MKDRPKIPPRKFWEDEMWAHDNYQILLKNYANKWVAISNKSVVSANEDLKIVKSAIFRKFKDKPLPLLHIEDASHVY